MNQVRSTVSHVMHLRVNMMMQPSTNGYTHSAEDSLSSSSNAPVCRMASKVGTVALSPRGDWRMPSDACSEVWLRDLEKVNPEVYRSTGKSRLIL